MEYEKGLVEKLDQEKEIIVDNGIEIELKEIPDAKEKDGIDSRAFRDLEHKLQFQKKRKKDGNNPNIEFRRANMGGFNYNLNRKEIYTRYLEVETSTGTTRVWVYYPRKMEAPRPALIYIHGGGFIGGNAFQVENPCRLIAERADCVVCNLEYDLAPEYKYPTQRIEVYETLAYLHKYGENFGIDTEKIAIAGDSAGGNLAAVCALMDRDNHTNYLAAQILIYPKLIFTPSLVEGYQRDISKFQLNEAYSDYFECMVHIGSKEANKKDYEYLNEGEDMSSPYISPPLGKKEGLPKTLMILAEYDGLRLEGEFYAGQLKKADVPIRVIRYRGVCHAFFEQLGILPQAESAVDMISRYLNDF